MPLITTLQLTQEERQKLIGTYPLFSLLTQNDINTLSELMYEVKVPKDFKIVTEGGPVDSLYFIYQGNAKVTSIPISAESTGEITKAHLSEGDAIGITDASFFAKSGARTATVTSVSDMVLLGIGIKAFSRFMNEVNRLYPGLVKTSNKLLQINIIKNSEPYPYIQPENFLVTLEKMQELSVAAGKIIFEQGESAKNLYVIQNGQIDLVVENKENNTKKTVNVLFPFNSFGETGILQLGHYQATAIAQTDCTLLVFSDDFFMKSIKKDSTIAHISKKLWQMNVYPQKAAHLIVDRHKTSDGQTIYTLTDPAYHRFYRLSPEGWFIWQKLDGNTTPRDICAAYTSTYSEKNTNEILLLISHLMVNHFVECPLIMFNILDGKKSILDRIKSLFGL